MKKKEWKKLTRIDEVSDEEKSTEDSEFKTDENLRDVILELNENTVIIRKEISLRPEEMKKIITKSDIHIDIPKNSPEAVEGISLFSKLFCCFKR
jgi:hypothetical protein